MITVARLLMCMLPWSVAFAQSGFETRYYDGAECSGPAVVAQVESSIDHRWAQGRPAGITGDAFSVRWLGLVTVPATGEWVFTAHANDGFILSLDGQVVINDWSEHAERDQSTTVVLTAGQHVVVEAAYCNLGGPAIAQLLWAQPGEAAVPLTERSVAPLVTTDIAIPSASAVSPAFVETSVPFDVPIRAHAVVPIAIERVSPSRIAFDVPLAPEGTLLRLEVGDTTIERSIRWVPTDLVGISETIVRAGDSLLLRASVDGTVRISRECGIANEPRRVIAGDTLVYRFEDAGRYRVALAADDGSQAASLSVTAYAATFPYPLACQLGFARQTAVTVAPDGEGVTFAAADPVRLVASADGASASDVVVVRPRSREPSLVVARLGSATGPILAQRAVTPFTLTSNLARGYAYVRDEDGFGHTDFVLEVRPRVPGLRFAIEFFTGAATVNGQSFIELTSDDLDKHGDWTAPLLIMPDATITCHRIDAFAQR